MQSIKLILTLCYLPPWYLRAIQDTDFGLCGFKQPGSCLPGLAQPRSLERHRFSLNLWAARGDAESPACLAAEGWAGVIQLVVLCLVCSLCLSQSNQIVTTAKKPWAKGLYIEFIAPQGGNRKAFEVGIVLSASQTGEFLVQTQGHGEFYSREINFPVCLTAFARLWWAGGVGDPASRVLLTGSHPWDVTASTGAGLQSSTEPWLLQPAHLYG